MRTPKFTDSAKWRVPYVKSSATDIRRTFNRVRREQAQVGEERKRVLVQIKRKETK